ncbi:hypothetical protein [Streptosporangium canum]|uniref:hypothetical protein n=1 Tax=Streptosporangium canum TaxID=324952 RepID=UPI0015A666BE|nr:hypothetical protein [Streptosporangium canum]
MSSGVRAGRRLLAAASGVHRGVGSGGRAGRAGTRTELLRPGTLVTPLSVAVGPDGAVHVADKAMAPGQGEVLRVPVPE